MDLKLTIDANYEKASKAFNDLANSSEETREKIDKFSSSFQSENTNKFIDKQKLLEASLTGTRGEVAAMTTAQKNYEKEIERLIRSGLDPESDAILKLRNEHDKLATKIKETNDVQKAQEQVVKNAEKALLGMVAAIGASVAAVGVATQKTAEAGNQFAKTARVIGMTAETFQELDYAAKMSGVDNLKGSLEKLNKSVADVKSDTGTLTSYLKDNDKQLLGQIKNVKSNEEAFNLLMGAIKKAPNEFSRAELAQAAFGKSGQQLILLANEGAEGIANLREEARKYGVISNETAANSEAYLDSQSRLKSALQGVGTELTEKLLPGLTDAINGIADFIADIDDWEGILNTVEIALIGTAAALTTFIVVSKGADIVHKMAIAIKALQAAITGPAGIVAIAIGAIVVGIGSLINAYKKHQEAEEEYGKKLKENSLNAKNLIDSYENLNPGKKLDKETTDELLKLYPELNREMLENAQSIDEVRKMTEEASKARVKEKLERYIEQLEGINRTINSYADNLKNAEEMQEQLNQARRDQPEKDWSTEAEMIRAGVEESQRNLDNAKKGFTTYLEEANKKATLYGVRITEALDLENIPPAKIEIEVDINKAEKDAADAANKSAEAYKKFWNQSLSQRISSIDLNDSQKFNEQINQIKSFLEQRANLEKTFGEERIQTYEQELQKLLESDTLYENEKQAAIMAAEQAILEYKEQIANEEQKLRDEKKVKDKELSDSLIAIKRAELSAIANLFGSMSDLISSFGEDNYAATVAAKTFASAQAAINSYLAFTQTLADSTIPSTIAKKIMAGTILATGLAQQVKIMATPIPSAETGGRFIVPHSVGSDSSLMRVNSDETVDITPRGMTGIKKQNIIVQIEKQVLFDVMNDGIRSGDILISAANF